MVKIVAIDGMHEEGLNLIRQHAQLDLIKVADSGDREEIRKTIADAQGIMVNTTKLDAALLEHATSLMAVSRHGVGHDNVDVDHLTARKIPLFLAIDGSTTSVAEQALYMLLELAKRGREYDRATRTGNWSHRWSLTSIDLLHRSALIVGFGRIGRAVARLFNGIGMRVLVSDPILDKASAEALGCIPVDDFRVVLGEVDVVSVHVPLTASTSSLIGEDELSSMKRSAFVLNLARGGIVDEVALVEALKNGTIAGAGLDVFDSEPPPSSSPLFDCPNLILSPHSAGLSMEAAITTAKLTARNLVDFFAGNLVASHVANGEVLDPE